MVAVGSRSGPLDTCTLAKTHSPGAQHDPADITIESTSDPGAKLGRDYLNWGGFEGSHLYMARAGNCEVIPGISDRSL